MKMDLLKDNVTPAEGDLSVRSYSCTYYNSRLLGLKCIRLSWSNE